MDSRRRQRSIALHHIPPLPIPHGLEYPLRSRMHLGVVHPRLKARGRPFPRSPRSRSRVNLRVFPPLTQGPQGQPSPLWTPHGLPGVQDIFPTSHGQDLHGWPMVHHCMATGFPIPRGCCLAFSVTHLSLLRFVRDAVMSCSPLLFSVTGPQAVSLGVPFQEGCCAALAAPLSWPRPPVPSLVPCLYPSWPPATQWCGPTGSSSIWGPFHAPCTVRSYPVPFVLRTCCVLLTGPG